jgi:hypothetical protein
MPYTPGRMILAQTYEDPDARLYLDFVEVADGQALEPEVRAAVSNFVSGCKADGIWDAIKASCILAGARTLDGALVPLVGTAPDNFGFTDGNYTRTTGLKGDRSGYLDTNRNNNADPQNSKHYCVYLTEKNSFINSYPRFLTAGQSTDNGCHFVGGPNIGSSLNFSVNNAGTQLTTPTGNTTGFIGASRSTSSGYDVRGENSTAFLSATSDSPSDINFGLFSTVTLSPGERGDSRISFYSIGESLDLALLDTRVSTLMTDLAAAIP